MQDEIREFIRGRESFLTFLKEWEQTWPSPRLEEVVEEAGGPRNVAVVCTDLTVAFAKPGIGRLASPRVEAIIGPIVELFRLAHSLGVEDFALTQDAHPPDSLEFRSYGVHAMPGTIEAETVPELKELPFSSLFHVLPKQNLNPGIDTGFPAWLDARPHVKRYIVTGDVTDLCVYQTAMYLRLRANQFNLDYEVIVPSNCVDTFETPYVAGRELEALPHDAELLHLLFLYHMALNGIIVVRELRP